MKYKSPTTAMRHQRQAIGAAANKPPVPCPEDVFAYLMDMGTGKSKVVLDEWGEMATTGGATDLLLLAPKSSIRNWYMDKGTLQSQWSELRKHVDPAFLDRLVHHTWVGDGKAWEDKMRRLLAAPKDRPRALFMNIESLSQYKKNSLAFDTAMQFIERGAHVVVDESTTIKSDSHRTDAAILLGKNALSKRILSGLWTPKSPMDLFYQCSFLDERILKFTNYYTFRRRYAILKRMRVSTGQIDPRTGQMKMREFDNVVGFQNQEELSDKVRKYSYRVLKKDCLDLAPKVYEPRDVEMTKEQKQMIRELKLFGHAAIGDTGKFATTDMVLKRIIREIQICCGYIIDDEDRVLHEVPENKTRAMMEVLEEHNGKAIIWVPWHAPLQKVVKTIKEEYGPNSVAQFHGKNVRTRYDEESRFLQDPECKYMVATQAAGMRGNTWVNADLTIYYANTDDLEHRDQSEDRNHRQGQVNRVTYVDLVTLGSHEWKVLKSLRNKMNLATAINKEGPREWLLAA